MPATRALRGDLIGFLVRFVRRNGVLRTAVAGGLATAAASALLCYAAYLALGWPFTPVAIAMPIVAPLLLAPAAILLMANAMARLEASEEALTRATDASGVMLWEADLRSGEVALSANWAALLGQAAVPARVTVADLARLVHPEDLERVVGAQMEMLKGLRPGYAAEHRVRAASGEWRWVLSRGRVTERDPATGRALRASGTNVDISERKLAEEALQRAGEDLERLVVQRTAELSEERQRLQNIIDGVPDVVFVADTDLRHVVVNQAAANLVGVPRDSLIGKVVGTAQSSLSQEEKARIEAHHREVLASGSPVSPYETVRRDSAGKTRHFRVQKLPLKDAHGKASLVLTVGNDITELKLAEEELRRLNEELEKRVAERTAALSAAVAELESFSYSVSHDLRAPARAVAGFARIVMDDFGSRLPEDGRRMLARVSRAGEAMGAMVDGLLELSGVSRGELQRRPVDMVLLAAEVWRDLSAAEPARRVELHMDPDIRVEGDPVLLRNLLLNLLGNARKYSRNRADAAVCFGRTPEGEFYVRDNGVGFDTAHAGKLFGAFQRLHSEREFEGHGIGLALCRKIVERHGGRIRADAEPGKGAAFFFTLP